MACLPFLSRFTMWSKLLPGLLVIAYSACFSASNLCHCLVARLYSTLCDPIDCNMEGFSDLHCLPEFVHTHVHWVSDAVQPSHPLSSPSPALNLSQHQGLFQWVGSLHQVAEVLELQHQSFQWIFRTDFLVGWTGLILQSNELWRVFCSTTVQRHQFFGSQTSFSLLLVYKLSCT